MEFSYFNFQSSENFHTSIFKLTVSTVCRLVFENFLPFDTWKINFVVGGAK